MTSIAAALRLYELIGKDAHVHEDECAGARMPELAAAAWEIYEHHFGSFTGAAIDPLFHRFDHPATLAGRPVFDAGSLVVIAGTGPSLAGAADDLMRVRDRVHVVTSPRGADALARVGVGPDLILATHATPLDAELSARHARGSASRVPLSPTTWIAAEPRTPRSLVESIVGGSAADRIFVPSSGLAWGQWPASAVSLAIAGGARRFALVGIDLGTPDDGVSQAFEPLAALLALLSTLPGLECTDCGPEGAAKRGWNRRPLADVAPAAKPGPLIAALERRTPAAELRIRARIALARLSHVLDRGRRALDLALAVRAGGRSAGGAAPALEDAIDEMMSWGADRAIRRALQDEIGLSFLPRFWRTGVDPADRRMLWRPVVLALHELAAQADALHARLGPAAAPAPEVPKTTAPLKHVRPSARPAGDGETRGSGAKRLARPSVLVLPLTYACNVRCEMCTIWRREDPQHVTRERFETLIGDPLVRASLEVINLTGGEPFLRSDLPDLVGTLVGSCPRLKEIGIPTNGSMPPRIEEQTRRILAALPDSVLLSMIVSLDGGPAAHDKIRGVPGLYARTVATLRLLASLAKGRRNMTVGINMTVTPANVQDVEGLRSLALETGVGLTLTPAVDSDMYIDSGAVRDAWSGPREAWAGVASALRAQIDASGGGLEDACRVLDGGERRSPCVFWTRGLFVDADGGLYVCPVTSRGRFGTYRAPGDVEAAWGSPDHRATLDRLLATDCRTCLSNCMSSEADRDGLLAHAGESGRPIVIFGAGAGGRKVYQRLRDRGVQVDAFVDNAAASKDDELFDLPVHGWDEGAHCRGAFTVIASATGSAAIARQLTEAGLVEGRDFVRYF